LKTTTQTILQQRKKYIFKNSELRKGKYRDSTYMKYKE
jgi:hypothetical protein